MQLPKISDTWWLFQYEHILRAEAENLDILLILPWTFLLSAPMNAATVLTMALFYLNFIQL